ncbi:MAG: type II secretion system secretin GspD [Acidobacteriota bacterium]
MKTHPALSRPRAIALATAVALTFGPTGLLPGFAGLAMAAAVKKAPPSVTLNFVNADIEGVSRAMAAIVDRQIMVDPRVKGTITLYSEQPLTPREAYLNYLAALRGQGFSVVEVSGMLKVVPEAEAKLQTGTVDVGSVTKSGDQVITQIFRLQYENANNMVAVLRPLISPNNTINANPGTNTLVITDYADNLKRMGQMIAALDVPSATDMEALPLQYAIASDLAPVVQKLADGGATPGVAGAGTQGTLVIADPRTNTLMVRAPNVARMNMVRNLVQRLDKPGTSGLGGSGIHVVYLKNADAVKLAQVLRAAFPGGASGGGASASSSPSALSPSGVNTQMPGANSAVSSGMSQQATSPVAASAQPSTGGFIQADPSTNSLVITATDSLYKQLRAVIDQLDGRRAQIYIEAMIVEVNEQKLAEAGFQWSGLLGNKDSRNAVGMVTNLPQDKVQGLVTAAVSPLDALGQATGLNIGLVHNYGDGRYGLAALATFLETKTDANILSKPNMVSLDNEEAKIVVGRNVPFVTGSYTNGSTSTSTGTVNPFTTVERKDVGLTLRVKPQVGEGGTVRLTVFQEKSDVESTSSTQGPTTTKSSIETTVVIDDGQTLILGGLLKDQYGNDDSQVPLLGDIPVIGNLFKSRARKRDKTNLMVFLRPVVLRNQDAANDLTVDRYDFIRQRQVDLSPKHSVVLPINEAPLIDPLSNGAAKPVPNVVQPLDDPNAAPTIVMPKDSGYGSKLAPKTPQAGSPR